MKRTHFLITLAFCAFFICLVSFTPLNNAGLVVDVLNQTNQFRKSKSLPELIMRNDLNAIAQKHSSDMARGRVGFGHGGFEKRNALASQKISPMKSFAENVAFGASTGKEVVIMWKNSSGHRKNMLGGLSILALVLQKTGRVGFTIPRFLRAKMYRGRTDTF